MKGAALIFLLGCSLGLDATHLRAGQILLERQNSGSLTYKVTLQVYTNTGADIRFGDGTLDFGDGTQPYTTPTVENIRRPDLGTNVGYVEVSVMHTYAVPGRYVISYIEPNLNAGIINIFNSVETRFFLEAQVLVDPNVDSSSPTFLTVPFFRHPIGKTYSLSAQAADKNDYVLTYELVDPLQPGSTNYVQPPLSVNPESGEITWDTSYNNSFTVGEYYFGVKVTQRTNQGMFIGSTIRTFQAILVDARSNIEVTTSLPPNHKVTVLSGKKKVIKVLLQDDAAASVFRWSVFADQGIADSIRFTQYDSASGSKMIKVGLLTLKTYIFTRNNPYSITLRGTSGQYNRDVCILYFTREEVITTLADSEKSKPTAYPNPFSDRLTISGSSRENQYFVTFIDAYGRTLLTMSCHAEDPIEPTGLPTGIYVMLISDGTSVYRQRIIRK